MIQFEATSRPRDAAPRPGGRRHRLITAAGLAAATFAGGTAMAGAASAPRPTTPSTPTPTTPPAEYESLSIAGGRTAVLRRAPSGEFDVLVGGGIDLAPAAGLAPLVGSRAQYADGIGQAGVHAGTDADGRPVLVYPRCRLVRRRPVAEGSCDLYVFDVDAKREQRIPGVRRRGRNESEGVMERGALAYTASSSKAGNAGLWYRSAAGRERRVARNAGDGLALHGRQIASVVVDGRKENGEEPCENRTLVLRSLGGKVRMIARDCIDTYSQTQGWTTPSFIAGGLYWGSDMNSGPALFRHDLRTHAVEQASVAGRVHGFQATSATTGVAAIQSEEAPEVEDREVADTLVALDRIAWSPRIRSIIKTTGHPDPAALR